jgi:hypothetical protein
MLAKIIELKIICAARGSLLDYPNDFDRKRSAEASLTSEQGPKTTIHHTVLQHFLPRYRSKYVWIEKKIPMVACLAGRFAVGSILIFLISESIMSKLVQGTPSQTSLYTF